jgi:serine/threonine protein phosphatase PrpC
MSIHIKKAMKIMALIVTYGGEGGIRTLGALTRTPDFESGTFDHSATSPRALHGGACEPEIIRAEGFGDNNHDIRHAPPTRRTRLVMIEFGHGTHVGLRRRRNEDTYYADASLGLFLVADGMGGHQHGEVASAMVRDTVVDLVTRGHSLVEAVQGAGERLLAHARGSREMLPMGTTIAALRVVADGYEVAWVGDSRIYRWKTQLQQISHDHSLVQELVEAGQLEAAQASKHPQRNVLTQALGVTASEQLHIGMARGRLEVGMAFLLCTDGLTECLADAAIAATVARTELATQECVEQLLLGALDGGGDDNITVVIVRYC